MHTTIIEMYFSEWPTLKILFCGEQKSSSNTFKDNSMEKTTKKVNGSFLNVCAGLRNTITSCLGLVLLSIHSAEG